jgi:hypothetical protein
VRAQARTRHLSRRIDKTYAACIGRSVAFQGRRDPHKLASADVAPFLTWLAVERRVTGSTQNQALAALLLLYRVLGLSLEGLDGVVRAKQPGRLPVLLPHDEVSAGLERLHGTPLQWDNSSMVRAWAAAQPPCRWANI